jgi:hypothetical protein
VSWAVAEEPGALTAQKEKTANREVSETGDD